ncbi:MAG: single-stranded DNA-binding protein [Flavobacteriales bacterium]
MNGTVNKVILVGNLGDAVKMHYFDDKNAVGRFPLATSASYTDKSGTRIAQTEWHHIVVRNRLAEICEKHLQKGDKVYVEGRLKTRKWESDGTMHYTTAVHASSVEFLSNKKDSHDKGDGNPHDSPIPDDLDAEETLD